MQDQPCAASGRPPAAGTTAEGGGVRLALASALLIGLMGLAPHAVFSWQNRQLCFFTSEDDEDYYNCGIFRGDTAWGYRTTATLVMRTLRTLCGGDKRLALIAADFVLPFLACLAAAGIAWSLCARRGPRLLACMFLLFGFEVLSLGCYSIWPGKSHALNLLSLRAALPSSLVHHVPDSTTGYYELYRTPEPQISIILLFLLVGTLVRRLPSEPRARSGPDLFLLLVALNACLPFIYIFLAVPLVMVETLYCLALWRAGRSHAWSQLAAALVVSAVAWALSLVLIRPSVPMPTSRVFASRQVILTTSVVWSAMLLLLVAALRAWRRLEAERFWLGLILAAAPILVLNQQVVTGRMVMSAQWERYVCYPLLVPGALLLLPGLKPERLRARPALVSLVAWIFLLYWGARIFAGEAITYALWKAPNETCLACQRALAQVPRSDLDRMPIVMQSPRLAGIVSLIMETPFDPLLPDAYVVEIPRLPEDGRETGSPSYCLDALYEHFARNGWTPGDVAHQLAKECEQRGDFTYFFWLLNTMDYWPVLSDGVYGGREVMERHARLAVEGYTEYLSRPHDSWRRSCLLLTSVPPNRQVVPPGLMSTLLGEGVVGGTTIYACVQRPK